MFRIKCHFDLLPRGILAISAGAFLHTAQVNAEVPDFIEVDPVAHTTYGHGFDTTRRIAFARGGGCVEIDRSKTYSQGKTSSKSGFEKVTSTSEVSEEMNLSVSASLSALVGTGKISASAKTDVASKTEASQFNETILAFSYTRLKPVYLDPTYIRLKQKYVDMLKDPKKGAGAFKAECGDTFVYGIQEGREYYATTYISKQTLKQWTKFSVAASASYDGATVTAKGAADYAKAMSNNFGGGSIKIHVNGSDTGLNSPTTVEQMVQQFESYNAKSTDTNAVKFILSSYANADGFPIADPLSPPSNDEKLGYMVSALWDLKALQQDAGFIAGNPDMFALGTTKEKRQARQAAVRTAKAEWSSEFDTLRAKAGECLKSFKGFCDALAQKYKKRDPLAERAKLPIRYSSDCKQQIQLSGLGNKVSAYQMPNSAAKGDTEMGSGPVKVRTWMDIYKDGTQLKLRHKTALYEWKTNKHRKRITHGGRNTEFRAQNTVTVFDLDQPNIYANLHGSLSECQYLTNPVSAPYLKGTKWHGTTDATSGKKPRGQVKLTGGARGMLTYSYCELDRKGKDGNLPCSPPGIRNTYVKLVNKLDVAADEWHSAADTKQVATAKHTVSATRTSRKLPKASLALSHKAAIVATGVDLAGAKAKARIADIAKAAHRKELSAKARAARTQTHKKLPPKIQSLLTARNKKTRKH